jgi:hypothetical protein
MAGPAMMAPSPVDLGGVDGGSLSRAFMASSPSLQGIVKTQNTK